MLVSVVIKYLASIMHMNIKFLHAFHQKNVHIKENKIVLFLHVGDFSDRDGSICRKYGVMVEAFHRAVSSGFIIDRFIVQTKFMYCLFSRRCIVCTPGLRIRLRLFFSYGSDLVLIGLTRFNLTDFYSREKS